MIYTLFFMFSGNHKTELFTFCFLKVASWLHSKVKSMYSIITRPGGSRVEISTLFFFVFGSVEE